MINKSVDIDQLVDYDVLEIAILDYLKGSYSEEYILEQLRINISGDNRLKKGLRIVKKVVTNNPIGSLIIENKTEVEIAAVERISQPEKIVILKDRKLSNILIKSKESPRTLAIRQQAKKKKISDNKFLNQNLFRR